MSISFVSGDLFLSRAEAIGHGVNCKGVMGAGIATEFKRRYPDMFCAYRSACNSGCFKPGTYQVFYPISGPPYRVINLATQAGTNGAEMSYLREALGHFATFAEHVGIRTFAIPAIGAGLGGLNWNEVKAVLIEILGPAKMRTFVYEKFLSGVAAVELLPT